MSLSPEQIKQIELEEEAKYLANKKEEKAKEAIPVPLSREQLLQKCRDKITLITTNLSAHENKRGFNPFLWIAQNGLVDIDMRLKKPRSDRPITPEEIEKVLGLPDDPDCSVDCGYPEGYKEKKIS